RTDHQAGSISIGRPGWSQLPPKLRPLLLLLALFLLPGAGAFAGITVDTARGLVGEHLRVRIIIPPGGPAAGPAVLKGTLRLSNPTVFFPDSLIAARAGELTAYSLTARKDSIYDFSISLLRDTAVADTLYLAGEALAGSDSVCLLLLSDLTLDGTPRESASGAVFTRSVGAPLPYVRFAILDQNYPNPARQGSPTTWAYRIDRLSDVRFYFYNVTGAELFVADLGNQPIGPHTFIYTPGIDVPCGVYLVRLVTNSGIADKVMHIVR
ncbi:MAG: T9SS type A sorting domain-containing protein, partial [Candidatus Kapaibacterium sp.]